jgi:hypothetical protein
MIGAVAILSGSQRPRGLFFVRAMVEKLSALLSFVTWSKKGKVNSLNESSLI